MSLPATLSGLPGRYDRLLADYVERAGEEALAGAYQMGRDAVDAGLGVLDLASLHRTALVAAVRRAATTEECARVAGRAAAFLTESLAPFELIVHHGFREASAGLREAHTALELRALELSETNAALVREQSTAAGVMASMSDGVVVFDRSGRARLCNARAAELLAVDHRRPELIDGAAVLGGLGRSAGMLAAPTAAVFETTATAPPRRELLVHLFPVAGHDDREALGIVLRDVTQERELARAKDELVATVSHELRTPLTSVVGFAELLLARATLGDGERRQLQILHSEALRLAALIDDFLDLQRMDQPSWALQLEDVDLEGVLRRAAEAANPSPAHRVLIDVEPDLPLVRGDPERLLQVVVNLLANAVKYSPDGGKILLAARRRPPDDVEVTIADQGLGIPPEALDRLFQRFFRVDSPDRRGISGTGLGLAICQGIVEAHGGDIRAESDGLGQGTRLTFTLPVAA